MFNDHLFSRCGFYCLSIALLGAVGCELYVNSSNCPVDGNSVAEDPANKFSVTHTSPERCPVAILQSGELHEYAATVRANVLTVSNVMDLAIVNANGVLLNFQEFFFAYEDSEVAAAQPRGSYAAGTVRRPFGGGVGADTAYNRAAINGGVAIGNVTMQYREVVLSSLNPVTGSVINEMYNQEVTLTQLASPVGSVSYEWFQNGVSLGPSSPSNAAVSTYFDFVGQHTLEVVATDAVGGIERWGLNVTVSQPGGCFEPPCP